MKKPFFIIAGLFLLAYIAASQFSGENFADKPVTLSKNNPPEILMLGSDTCQYCKLARAFFTKHELPYTEKNIDVDGDARRMFDLMNGRGTPLIIINGQIIHGYDERMIREAL